jgi:hypothetical protein
MPYDRDVNECLLYAEMGFWADFPQGKKRKILIALKKLFLATGHH